MAKTKQQLGKLSRNKGANNENKLAKVLDEWFYKHELKNWASVFPNLKDIPENKKRILRRTPLSGGWSKCGDLRMDPEYISRGIPAFPFFIEAKNEKKLDETQVFRGVGSLYSYLKQATEENNGKNPITAVIFTTERRPYYVVVSEKDFEVIEENSKLQYLIRDRENKVVQFYLKEFMETADLEFFRSLSGQS